MENIWLEPVVEAYRKYFGPTAEVIFDVGSRDGDDAAYLAEKLGGTEIFCIEANPDSAEVIQSAYPEFKTIKMAVGDYNGHTKFLQISGDKDAIGTSSMDVAKNSGTGTVIVVPIARMDGLLTGLDLSDRLIDVMKIDVESYTMEALQGLGEKLRSVKVYHLETERAYSRPGHANNLAVAEFMRSNGFFLVDVSYEWGDSIQDQVWINTTLVDPAKAPTVEEISAK